VFKIRYEDWKNVLESQYLLGINRFFLKLYINALHLRNNLQNTEGYKKGYLLSILEKIGEKRKVKFILFEPKTEKIKEWIE
jgi:hypothetical protein